MRMMYIKKYECECEIVQFDYFPSTEFLLVFPVWPSSTSYFLLDPACLSRTGLAVSRLLYTSCCQTGDDWADHFAQRREIWLTSFCC